MNDSKEHIITIASKLFLQKSYKEVTMKDIVKKTGLSKGAFYHYFESKEQLFIEVLDFFFTCVMKHEYEKYSQESFYQFYHDYADELRKVGAAYLNKFIGDKNEDQFNINYFTLAFDALKLFPEFRGKMMEGLEQELDIWKKAIKRARENGEINSLMTDDEIAKIFIYLSDGIAMHLVMQDVKIEDMVAVFLNLWDRLYDQIKI